MGKTMSEKILSTASSESVSAGDFVWAKVDLVSLTDKIKYFEFIDRHALPVWNPDRIVICFDHFMYPDHGLSVAGLPKVRRWAERHRIPKENVYDIGRHGITHQVPAEEGWIRPGTVYAAADTQGSTMGALNCFALACVGSIDYILVTGDTWVRVPESIRIDLKGRLPKGVLGKDIYLRLMKDLEGIAEGRVLEFAGPGVKSMSMDVRMAVANGATHLGAVTMIFPPDDKLIEYLRPRARQPSVLVSPDSNARYFTTRDYDLGEFEPLVSGPDDPRRVSGLANVEGIKVHAAYIGSCSSGRMEDLRLAAEVLEGKKIHPNVRLVVTPISSKVMEQAGDEGLLTVFARAGATITTPGCGACFYGNQSPLLLDDDEVCITGSVENWPGRMGSDKAHIYLANAAVVAASAVCGEIADPAKVSPGFKTYAALLET